MFYYGRGTLVESQIWVVVTGYRACKTLRLTRAPEPVQRFEVWSLEFSVQVFGCLVSGFWFMVSGFWFLISSFWFLVSGFWFLVSGF